MKIKWVTICKIFRHYMTHSWCDVSTSCCLFPEKSCLQWLASFPWTFITGLAHSRQTKGSPGFLKTYFFVPLCTSNPVSLWRSRSIIPAGVLTLSLPVLDIGLLCRKAQSLHCPCLTAQVTDRWTLPHLCLTSTHILQEPSCCWYFVMYLLVKDVFWNSYR